MRSQQSQAQGEASTAFTDVDVEAVARRNFELRNRRGDRAWARAQDCGDRPAFALSDRERAEFLEQARHQLEIQAERRLVRTGLKSGTPRGGRP